MVTNSSSNNTFQLSANSIFGNNTGSNALGIDLTVAQTNTLLGITTNGTAAVGQLPGTTTNDNAAAGKSGEYVSSVILAASAVTLSNGITTDLTFISLTAGDWDVWGNISFSISNTAATYQGWLNNASVTVPDVALRTFLPVLSPLSGVVGAPVPSVRYSLSTTTTIYITVNAAGTFASATVCGGIYARRVR